MKNNKQFKDLSDKIEQIELYYNDLMERFTNHNINDVTLDELTETLDKAKAWDIFKAKCANGAKVGASNMSKKERIDRAKHASDAKKLKVEKEKERKRLNQIAKHRR